MITSKWMIKVMTVRVMGYEEGYVGVTVGLKVQGRRYGTSGCSSSGILLEWQDYMQYHSRDHAFWRS